MEKQQYIDFAFVKQNADFNQVLGYYHLTPTNGRSQGQLTLLCPFHNDTKPSLKITPEKKGFHCFGCGAKGNVLDFVRYMENCDLREAAEILATICRIDLAPPRASPADKARPGRARPARRQVRRPEMAVETPKRVKPIQSTVRAESSLQELPNGLRQDVVDEGVNPPLRFALKLDTAHPYLKERGLSDETIERFGLGFCSKGVMAGRIAIPIHDEAGNLVAYAGRWPGDNGWPEGEDRYKFPQGFHKSRVLFNLHNTLDEEHLIIVEGYWSVFRLQQLGYAAVALMGRSLSPEQEELILKRGPDRLTLLLDADQPGRTATAEILPRLASRHFVYVPALPDDASPDSIDEALLTSLFLHVRS